jgi:O-antigen ligase
MDKLAKIIEYLFYTFVFLLPWQTRWVWHYCFLGKEVSQYLTFSLYASELVLFLLLILALVYRWKNRDQEISLLNYRLLNFYILIALFFLVGIITLLVAQNLQVAFYYLTKMLEGFALLLFIVNFKFSYLKVGWAIVLAGLIQAGLGIYQFVTQTVAASKWLGIAKQLSSTAGVSVVESGSMRWLRAYGGLPHPNTLAGFLAICLVMLLILIFLTRARKHLIIMWLMLPIMLTGFFFTFSKSGWLALAIGLTFISIFVLLSQDKEAKLVLYQYFLALLTILAILVLFYQDPVLARWSGEGRLEVKSQTERVEYFDQAKVLLAKNWYKGVGLGNYTLALYNDTSIKLPAWDFQPVHNVYLLVACELGVLGFIIFMLLIIESLRAIYEFKIEEHLGLLSIFRHFKFFTIYDFYQQRFYWFLGLSSVFLMLLVIMVFDHYLWTLYFGIMLWWLLWGLWLKQASLVK